VVNSIYNRAPVTETRTRVLILLSLAELLAMSLWFTGTAVLPVLVRRWHGGLGIGSWLTIAVQLGFVVGALVIAVFNLSDVFRAPRIFVACTLLAAAVNAAFALVAEQHMVAALLLRALTGAFLAGVYPTGMKILAGWFRAGRGLALGAMVGALTVGSALPHGVLAIAGGLDVAGLDTAGLNNVWQLMVLAVSGLAVIAAAIVAFAVHEGPFATPSPPFDAGQIGEALRNRRLRLANFGYLGHMWELYSMWGWIAVLLAAARQGGSVMVNELIAFLAIAIGIVGCVWAGHASDRLSAFSSPVALDREGSDYSSTVAGRARVTIYAMAVSGACCLAAAIFFQHFIVLVLIAMVWGIAVIADSAQFSTIVSEVADPSYIGTALTMQTALGFLLTTVALRTTAAIAANYGWRWAAASMAVGPALGIVAMARLKSVQN